MRTMQIWAVAAGAGLLALAMAGTAGARQTGSALAGTWTGTRTFRRGTRTFTSTSTFVFKVDGDHFTGTAVTGSDRREIEDGAIRGGTIGFTTRNGFSPDAPLQVWSGTWDGKHLAVRLTEIKPQAGYPYAVPARMRHPNFPPMALRKVSGATVYELPPALRHPPLPPLKTLPPNGLALTPPMGWNSWNKFHGAVNDRDVREMADAMVATGMKAAGYEYVNIDDTWEGGRDAQGNIVPNSKFPNMKALADYVHSKGLKLGIYSSPGPKTCAGYTGSYLHEAQDARTYAAWGIDYLKYDWCSASMVYRPDQMEQAYELMAEALRATGRPIVYSLCQYGDEHVERWGALVGGNLWRTTGDIADHYDSMARNGFSQNGLEMYAGPGHWNDPDMLEIGNGGMTPAEYETHMSLWAILAAPLIAGNDLTKMTPATLKILTNREVIAVDQDKLGEQGRRVWKQGDLEIWTRPLAGGAVAVGLFNRGTAPAPMTVSWASLGIRSGDPVVRDLWAHTTLHAPGRFTATVAGHGVVLLRVQ
jgi:alpha-galactosidase